jgi:hypothetical protein
VRSKRYDKLTSEGGGEDEVLSQCAVRDMADFPQKVGERISVWRG